MLVGCTAGEMYDSVFYCLVSTDATFQEAQIDCANRPENASLVTIDNADINNFITYFAGGRGSVWIGATDQETEGLWKWPNGDTLDFTSWRSGQPNNYGGSQNCAALNYRSNFNTRIIDPRERTTGSLTTYEPPLYSYKTIFEHKIIKDN